MKFNVWFRNKRNSFAYSQEELAKELEIGLSTIQMYEAGTSIPRTSTIRKIATFFKVEVEEITKILNNKGE